MPLANKPARGKVRP